MVTFLRAKVGCVTQNLSDQHTHSGSVFEQGYVKLYPDMSHDMVERPENGEISLWNCGSLHAFQWNWHLSGGETMNPCHVTTICTHLLQVQCQDVLQNNEIIPTHTPATPTPPAADMGCVFFIKMS